MKSTPRIRGLLTSSLVSLALLGASAPAAARAHLQVADMIDRATGLEAPGAVVLHRTRRTVTAAIRAAGLDPDSAYTAWWIVFNRPGACADSPCTAADLRDPAVRAANFYATGFVTDAVGAANVDAILHAGRLPRGLDYVDLGTGVRPGLAYGRGERAEIHMVFRSHGPIEPGRVATQIGSGEFGTCEVCVNQRSVVFLPAR